MYHDGVRVDRPLIPDAFVYLFRREDPSGILHQESENLKFDRRQLCRLFVHRDFHGILVQLQSADDINVALFLLFLCLQHIQILSVPSQLGINSCKQLHRSKWFRYIVIGTDIQSHDLVDLLRLRGKDNHRKVVFFSQLDSHGNAIHSRHHHIHDSQMYFFLIQNLKALDSIGRLEYFIALAL